jgi:hypothetical protein
MLSILGVCGLCTPVFDGRPPTLMGVGFGIGWGGSGNPTIGGANKREEECEEGMRNSRLFRVFGNVGEINGSGAIGW